MIISLMMCWYFAQVVDVVEAAAVITRAEMTAEITWVIPMTETAEDQTDILITGTETGALAAMAG